MRHRMSRSNKSRRTFKVDSLLQTVTSRLHQQEPISGFLTLTFLGFYNKSSGISQEEPVKVETLLLKICHKKRKDVSCPVMTVSLGTSYVPYNPSEEFPPPKAPTVSIPTESFSLSGHLVKSYHLLLRVATMTSNLLSINSDMDSGGGAINGTGGGMSDEEKLVQFGTDLVIYDKQNRCLLSDGEYEFYLEEIHGNNSGSKIAHALSTWEEIGFDKELKEQHLSSFEKMSNGPTLKVRLQWSREPVTPMVDRPLPLVPVDKNDLSNKENNRPGIPKGCSKLRDRPSVVYQFLYNNNSKQQTEASCDMHCPWCSIDCRTLYSLLKHLKLCHPRFSFTYVPTQSGARIDVSLNEGYDGSYSGAPSGGGGGARGAGPVRRTPLSHVIVCHPRRPHPALTEFLHMDENEFDAQRPYITGHNRLYHHTTTCLPIYPKEMDIDSEDETDPRWLQKKTMMMIDEFTDVNEGEKELMKMWNLHVMRHGVRFVGDCQIALACTMFLQQRAEQLLSKNLYRNFVLHMCNLFDFGLISPVTVYTTVQKLQEMIGVEDTK
ncbi:hypothetical protein AAG570_013720 [Ranatra chinensis]|uniref:Polycomb protein VEFS-Box domain-containing protein n=1 Tax=Ranatra chinensis TaxID=642074 RepID=A0ABD0YD10_9HEMI